MHMVVLAVHLFKCRAKVSAYAGKNAAQRFEVPALEYISAVFWYEHQMHMKRKNAVPSRSVILRIIFHTPSVIDWTSKRKPLKIESMGFGKSKRIKHSRLGTVTVRAYHFRVEATHSEFARLYETVTLAWELRNQQALLLEDSRKEAKAAKLRGEEPQYLDALELKKMVAGKRIDPKFSALHSQVRQEVSMRVSEGQQRWFEALKEGRHHVKPPGAICRKKFRSITYPQYGATANIKNGRLHLAKLGDFKIIGWRRMRGAKKSITLKFKDGHWWAICMCQVQEKDVCRPYAAVKDQPAMADVGIDPGLTSVMTDSFGHSYDTPKPLKAALKKLKHLSRDMSRKFEVRKKLHMAQVSEVRKASGNAAPVASGLVAELKDKPLSNRLKASIVKVARLHTKVGRIRKDAAHKTARRIERRATRAAVEEHSLDFMLKNKRLARSAADVGIGLHKSALKSAMGPGRYMEVSTRRPEGGNSQTCLCGQAVPKLLKDRWHSCPACGLEMPRDQMSAIIVQHTGFGTLPALGIHSAVVKNRNNSTKCTPGLGVLEHAAKVLEIRREEAKRVADESRRAESKRATAAAAEASVKRPAQRKRSMRKTTGEAKAASVEVNTAGHAGIAGPCPVETKVRVPKRAIPHSAGGCLPVPTEKHPPSGG